MQKHILFEAVESRQMLSASLPSAQVASLAYDDSGTLHAAWYDLDESDLKYATCASDGTLGNLTTVDAGPNVGSQLSLKLDSAGHAGIAYYDAEHGDLKFAEFDGSSWNVQTIDSKGVVGQHPSLAFDSSDRPIVSYYSAKARSIRVASFDGSKWRFKNVGPSGASTYSSIDVNPADGTWSVAYEAGQSGYIKFAQQNGKIKNIDKVTRIVGSYTAPSLAFDSNGAPIVSYTDPKNGALMTASPGGTKWTIQNIQGSGAGLNTSIDFDPHTQQPQIVYLNQSGSVVLTSLSSGTWSSVDLGSGTINTVVRDPRTNSLLFAASHSGGLNLMSSMPAPTGLDASAAASSQVNLTWTDNSSHEDGFVIERSVNGGAFATLVTLPADTTNYSDTDVAEDQSITYRVFAFDSTSASVMSSVAMIDVPLNAPTNLAANVDSTGVALTWTDQSSVETGYEVQRSADSGANWTTLTTTAADAQAYLDTTATPGIDYVYQVIAETAHAASDPAGPVHATVSVLSAPSVQASLTGTTAQISWTDTDTIVGGYRVFRSTDGTTFTQIATPLSSTTNYQDSGLTEGLSYTYRVLAYNFAGDGAVSANAAIAVPCAKPMNISAGISWDDITWLAVNWTDNSQNETGYRIERSTDGVSFSTIDILPANSNEYDDAEVTAEHTYSYRVVPINANGDGIASDVATATAIVLGPTNFVARATSPTQIDLDWTNVSTTATSLQVEGVIESTNSYFVIASGLDPTTTHYTVTQMASGVPILANETYALWVNAVRSDVNYSSFSGSVTTGYATPADLFIDNVTPNHMHLSWGDVIGEDGYEVQWSTDNVNFSTLVTTGADVTDYTLTTSGEARPYYFRVRALSTGLGDTAWSTVSQANTLVTPPTNVVAIDNGDGTFNLTWDDNSNVESQYIIEVTQGTQGWYFPITVAANTTSYQAITGPYGAFEEGIDYKFSVRADTTNYGASARGVSNTVQIHFA